MKRKDILPVVLEGVAVASTAAVVRLDQNNSVKIVSLDDRSRGSRDFVISLRRGKTREIAEGELIPKNATIIYVGDERAWSEAPVTSLEDNSVKFRTESGFHTLEYVFTFENIIEDTLVGKLVDGRPVIEFNADQDIGISVDFREIRNAKGVGKYFFKGFNWFTAGNDDMFLYYGDSFFETPATQYSPQLMTFAVNLELAACTEVADPKKRSQSIQRLLGDIGCDHIYVNDVYLTSPTIESTDVAIGSKVWNGYHLIFLILNGAHYSVEFAANLMLGKEGDHHGFALSCYAGLDALKAFVKERNITGKTKILITGYSRTAAGANLLSRELSDAVAEGKVRESIGDIELTQDDVYGLCFETPLCGYFGKDAGQASPTDPRYDNIWYTTNPDDPVTYVPTEKYGFVRYGHRVYINRDHDRALNRAMLANINAYRGKDAAPFYDMSKFRGIGGFQYMEDVNVGFVQKFFDVLGDRDFYYDVVEDDIVKMVYVGRCDVRVLKDIVKESGGLLNFLGDMYTYRNDYNAFCGALAPSVRRATSRYGYDEYEDNIVRSIFQIMAVIDRYCEGNIIKFLRDSYLRSALMNATRLVKTHYPDVTLSYLMLDDTNYPKPYIDVTDEESENLLEPGEDVSESDAEE